ncbi:glycosyltransferase family 2 protein [Pedobacter africanus]|uniref:Glycosyltransferase involved in cell wall bisynthesis n=1 Tax=Pedobacter africanus TaxID=151894 RepID=A0A1W2BDX5_9SPHI|nr:glycosyltransferase family 2 protein [Pedobacter africanus]SMC71175.1 Glycosyltransferase involved in cell wall bisynthesis [Pedobacter africanus]
MDSPKVSVIVPNYNHAEYLVQRIESILNQSYQDFEVIILDDCSTDNSKTVIAQYHSHPKIAEIIYNEQNSGSTFKQWEKGISKAKGEFIWIAESDDWCETNLLEELIAGITKEENTVISYCQSYCIQNTNIIQWQSQHSFLSEVVDGHEFIKKRMSANNSIFNASMVIWKKDLFYHIPKDFVNYKFCGDWLFWIELAKLGKVHISGRLLNYFRKHSNDVTGKVSQSGLNFIEELQVINQLYQEKMICESVYHNAYKKKFIQYWLTKDSIEPNNKKIIEEIINHPLSTKNSPMRLVPIGIWKGFKQKWKSSKGRQQ